MHDESIIMVIIDSVPIRMDENLNFGIFRLYNQILLMVISRA